MSVISHISSQKIREFRFSNHTKILSKTCKLLRRFEVVSIWIENMNKVNSNKKTVWNLDKSKISLFVVLISSSNVLFYLLLDFIVSMNHLCAIFHDTLSTHTHQLARSRNDEKKLMKWNFHILLSMLPTNQFPIIMYRYTSGDKENVYRHRRRLLSLRRHHRLYMLCSCSAIKCVCLNSFSHAFSLYLVLFWFNTQLLPMAD